MKDFHEECEKKLAASGCPEQLRRKLMSLQNDILHAREEAARAGRQMTEGALDAALYSVRQAMRLCERGA